MNTEQRLYVTPTRSVSRGLGIFRVGSLSLTLRVTFDAATTAPIARHRPLSKGPHFDRILPADFA